jgi:tetratricopeptide (TPR) repeat protein
MLYFLVFLLILVALFLITRPLTIFLHELGHAIPTLLLTKQKVTIYIGSYGDPKKSLSINLGMLVILFRYNPFAWKLGFCVPSAKTISINHQIICTMAGPLTSIIIAGIVSYIAFAYDLHGLSKLFVTTLFVSALVDLLINLIPNSAPVTLYEGNIIRNDGYKLRQLYYYKRLPKKFPEAVNLFNQQRFSEASLLFEDILSTGVRNEYVYRYTLYSLLKNKSYTKAKALSDAFVSTGQTNSDDLSVIGHAYSQLGLTEEAIVWYDKSLALNPDNKYSLNNKGYSLALLSRFEEALSLLNRAIELDINFSHPYNNRGFCKIKTGQTGDGLHDINYALVLDPTNSYCYKNLGIYHFDKGEFDEAIRHFTKAKELDDTTYQINKLIDETIQILNIRSSNVNKD